MKELTKKLTNKHTNKLDMGNNNYELKSWGALACHTCVGMWCFDSRLFRLLCHSGKWRSQGLPGWAIRPGGGLLSPKSYMDVQPAGPGKSDYLYTNFLPNFPPINIPFLKEKHPILTKLDTFYNIWPKIHPIYVIWALSSLMKTPPIAIPNSTKKRPKRQAHIRIPCQCENPPGRFAHPEGQNEEEYR